MTKEFISKKLNQKFRIAQDEKKMEEINELLNFKKKGFIELEKDEKMPNQQEIKKKVSNCVVEKAFSLDLEKNDWKTKYSIDGRFLILFCSNKICCFDVKTLNSFYEREIENIIDCIFLHNEKFVAISTSDSLIVINKNGQEIQCLRNYKDVTKLTFLKDHFLLVSLHQSPFLNYFDTTIGKEICSIYTKEKNCSAISYKSDGIVLVGGSKGVLKFFSPNSKESLCQVFINSSKIFSIATKNENFACSTLQGTFFYDFRKLNEPIYKLPKSNNVALSNVIAISFRNKVSTFLNGDPYLVESFNYVNSLDFAPFEDILTIGSRNGIRNMIIPGSGDPNIDIYDDSPFLTKNQRKNREIRKMLEKIPSNFIGSKFIVEEEEKIESPQNEEKKRKRGLSRFY